MHGPLRLPETRIVSHLQLIKAKIRLMPLNNVSVSDDGTAISYDFDIAAHGISADATEIVLGQAVSWKRNY